MPDLTSHASLYRRGNYRVRGYIGTMPQTVAMSRAVNMATITYPVKSITFDDAYSGSGSTANVKEGQTIVVYSGNTTTIKGYLRVAAGGTSATVIQVNEFSAGTVNLANDDKFDVLETYGIHDKLVSASQALNKDSRIVVSDNPTNPPPVANAGGLWFGFNDDGQAYATVPFDYTGSLNVDPDTSTKTYLTSISDGTITVGSTTTSSLTATFPVGARHIQVSVTDAGNSKTTPRQIPVRVYDHAANRPFMVSNATLDYSHEEGWAARFELPKGSEGSITSLPDGALIVFFTEEFYGNTRVSYGSNIAGRSHIKFVGYLIRNSISINALNNTVTFEAVSPLGILNKTPALPQLMVQSNSGTLWRHVKTLNTNRMLWYLHHWGNTADIYFDFVWQLTGSALNYRRVAVTDVSSIGAQLRDIAQSVNLRLTCDRLGRILFIQDYDYLSSANRANRTVVYNFTTADIRELDATNEHRGTVKFVRGEGITDGLTANSNKPVFSNAPGKAPAPFGTGSETLARQIVDTQTDINARTGFHFAKVNGLYDGRFVPQGARLRLPPGYGWLDPAYNEPFTMTLPASSNKRGVAFTTATKWTAQTASLSFNAETGTLDPVYTIDHETTGQPGTTYVKPQQAQNGLPDFPPIDLSMPVITLPDTTPPLFRGTANLAVFSLGSNTVRFVSDFNTPSAAGGPTVSDVALTLNGTIEAVVADPYSSKYTNTGSTVNCWIATTTRLYHCADLFGSRTITQLLVFAAATATGGQERVLATERAVQNFVMCASYYRASGGVTIATSTDGTTFTEATLSAHYNSGVVGPANTVTPTVWVSGKVPGQAFAMAFTSTGAGQSATSTMFRTTDYGANWAAISGFTNAQGMGYCLHIPWGTKSADDDRYIYWTKNTALTTIALMRTDRQTGIATNISPLSGGQSAGCPAGPISMDSAVNDRFSILISGARISGAITAVGLYGSRDGGNTWTVQQPEITSLANRLTGVRFASNSRNEAFITGEDDYGVAYTNNFGTFVDPRVSMTSAVIGIIGS